MNTQVLIKQFINVTRLYLKLKYVFKINDHIEINTFFFNYNKINHSRVMCWISRIKAIISNIKIIAILMRI